ncbi:MAG: hypothetical protein ACKPCG_05050 [Dolichospermum sp.]
MKNFIRSNFPFIYSQASKYKGSFDRKIRLSSNKDIYKNILSDEQGNNLIANLIKDGDPAMITRFGSIEAACVQGFITKTYRKYTVEAMSNNAGFFPADEELLVRFSQLFLDSSKSIDVLGVWFVRGEPEIIKNTCTKASLVKLRTLEPYYHKDPWSKYLEGKRVLVIHPFAETISSQYENHRKLIFANPHTLPDFKLTTLKAVQSVAGNKTQFASWFDAYDWMCDKVKDQEFDVAIIGCGAYGLPLAAYIKSIGKQSIHLGGATQILFGIKGKRWDEMQFFQSLYNEHWVRPNQEETVQNYTKVESGCYW